MSLNETRYKDPTLDVTIRKDDSQNTLLIGLTECIEISMQYDKGKRVMPYYGFSLVVDPRFILWDKLDSCGREVEDSKNIIKNMCISHTIGLKHREEFMESIDKYFEDMYLKMEFLCYQILGRRKAYYQEHICTSKCFSEGALQRRICSKER